MDRKIIITDLTRFKAGNDNVCIAGIDVETGECIRPMPYITQEICRKHNLLPGSLLQGIFSKHPELTPPHLEDYQYSKLSSKGSCSSKEFEDILVKTISSNIEVGFGVKFGKKQKSIPLAQAKQVKSSIITIEVPRQSVRVVEDIYDQTKVKIHFCDHAGLDFSFVPITDNGFFHFVKSRQAKVATALQEINSFIQSQDKVYLRVGLGRVWQDQFWLQVNGVYTFPEYHTEIRSYKND